MHNDDLKLSPRETITWYAIATVSYIAIGTWQKILLTWFIGPMWLVCTVSFGPRLWARLRGRESRAGRRTNKEGNE